MVRIMARVMVIVRVKNTVSKFSCLSSRHQGEISGTGNVQGECPNAMQ